MGAVTSSDDWLTSGVGMWCGSISKGSVPERVLVTVSGSHLVLPLHLGHLILSHGVSPRSLPVRPPALPSGVPWLPVGGSARLK